jgi:hypothetical protein
MNNEERELCILNDERLYTWWLEWKKLIKKSMRYFIRENKEEIDAYINYKMKGK